MFLAWALSVMPQAASVAAPPPRDLILSPPAEEVFVSSRVISLEVDGKGLASVVARVENREFAGVRGRRKERGAGRFFIFNVSLLDPKSLIRVEGTTTDGRRLEDSVLVHSSLSIGSPVRLTASRWTSEGVPAEIDLGLELLDPGLDVRLELYDFEGDGVVDRVSFPGIGASLTIAAPATQRPVVTVRTRSNLLFSSLPELGQVLRVLPGSVPDPGLAIADVGSSVVDLEQDLGTGDVYALDAASATVKIIDAGGRVLRSVPVPGASGPGGIGLDHDLNLFVADTGNDRVIKLLSASGYQLDTSLSATGSFGQSGSEPGQLLAPRDVAVVATPEGEAVFVSDAGNRRMQRFSPDGFFESVFDGADGAFPLSSPGPLLAPPWGGVLVADVGASALRLFSSDGASVATLTPEGLGQPTELDFDPNSDAIVVTDGSRGQVHLVLLGGQLLRSVSVGSLPLAATVVRSPQGARLLVSSSASSDLAVWPLNQDLSGQGPESVVIAFLAAFSIPEMEEARTFLTPTARERFDALVRDDALFARALSNARSVKEVTTTRYQAESSSVSVISQGQPATPIEFHLIRIPGLDQWRIHGL